MNEAWRRRAACIGEDPAVFFPEPGRVSTDIVAARAVCARCPVRVECLEYALVAEDIGIWGGTTPPQRAAIRRQRATRVVRPQANAVRAVRCG